MNISQERFHKTVNGLTELCNQYVIEIHQLESWLQERDARIIKLDQEIKDTRSNLVQANLDKEREQSLRFAAEHNNIEVDEQLATARESLKEWASMGQAKEQQYLAQIAALQVTITQLKKRISKTKKQQAAYKTE